MPRRQDPRHRPQHLARKAQSYRIELWGLHGWPIIEEPCALTIRQQADPHLNPLYSGDALGGIF
jgi:hypothetical protein